MSKKISVFSVVDGSVKWLSGRIEKAIRKKKAKTDSDVFDNLEKLHKLKEQGVITDEDYGELKSKLMEQV